MNRQRKKTLAVASSVIFLDMIGYGIVIPILPIYAQNLGASEEKIGFLFASYSLVLILTLLPFGMMVDRYGKKPFVVGGMSLLSLSSVLYATSHSLSQLTLSRMVQGLSASLTWAAALPLAAEASDETKRGLEMSAITVATGLGTILGPVVGGLGCIQTPFYLCAISSSVVCILALFLLKESEHERKYFKLWEKLTRIAKKGKVQAACIGVSFLYFAFGMLEVLFPLYMASHHYRRTTIGILFAVLGGSFVVVQPLIGNWSDRIGRTFPMILGLSIAAVVLPLPLHLTTLLSWIGFFILLGLAGAAIFTPSYPLIADAVRPNEQGIAYALNSWVFSVGYLIGPWVGGTLAGTFGMRMPFYLCSTLLLGGAFGIFFVTRKEGIGSVNRDDMR